MYFDAMRADRKETISTRRIYLFYQGRDKNMHQSTYIYKRKTQMHIYEYARATKTHTRQQTYSANSAACDLEWANNNLTRRILLATELWLVACSAPSSLWARVRHTTTGCGGFCCWYSVNSIVRLSSWHPRAYTHTDEKHLTCPVFLTRKCARRTPCYRRSIYMCVWRTMCCSVCTLWGQNAFCIWQWERIYVVHNDVASSMFYARPKHIYVNSEQPRIVHGAFRNCFKY